MLGSTVTLLWSLACRSLLDVVGKLRHTDSAAVEQDGKVVRMPNRVIDWSLAEGQGGGHGLHTDWFHDWVSVVRAKGVGNDDGRARAARSCVAGGSGHGMGRLMGFEQRRGTGCCWLAAALVGQLVFWSRVVGWSSM